MAMVIPFGMFSFTMLGVIETFDIEEGTWLSKIIHAFMFVVSLPFIPMIYASHVPLRNFHTWLNNVAHEGAFRRITYRHGKRHVRWV